MSTKNITNKIKVDGKGNIIIQGVENSTLHIDTSDSDSDDDVGTFNTGTEETVSTSSPGDQLIRKSIELLESSDDDDESFD